MDFLQLAKERYSCKRYSQRSLEKETLDRILEASRLAPTAKNSQEHHIYVLQSKEALDQFDQICACRYGAKTVLLVTYDREKSFHFPGGAKESGIEDASIVATHIMLAARAEGVDSCWINNFDPNEAKRVFALPETEEVVLMMDLGYCAEGAGPLPNHESRKELTETVSYL